MKLKKSILGTVIFAVSLMTIAGLSGLSSIILRKQEVVSQPENNDSQEQKSLPSMQKISLMTSDNVKIAANWYPVVDSIKGWVIFTHMMPATKESWDELARELQSLGYAGIAIDLRGHGESDGGPDGFLNYGDADYRKSIFDVEAAAKYLVEQQLASRDKVSVIGASIGANLALEYAAEYNQTGSAVLLSPGLNYRSVESEPFVKKLAAGQKLFLVSSRDDDDNVPEVEKLYEAAPSGTIKEMKIYDSAGHGTTMLKKEPELKNLIINFLEK